MTVIERIRETAREKKNISLTVLEQELQYSNGSLAKAKDIPSSRIMEIAIYLGVSMDFIMTGKEYRSEFTPEQATLDLLLSQDMELKEALKLYATLSDEKKKHIVETIKMISEGK